MTPVRVRGALVALALVLSGCSGGGGGSVGGGGDTIPSIPDEAPTPTSPGPVPTDTTAGSPSATPDIDFAAIIDVDESALLGDVRALVRTVDVGAVVHYAGFDIEVERVRFGFDPADFRVAVVDVVLTNRTRSPQSLQTVVEIHSQGVVSPVDRDSTPQVPSGDTGAGSFSLRLDTSFTFDDAILFFGREDRQRVQIPLGSSGELITREPVVSPGSASETDGISTVTVDAVIRQWDTADPRGQAPPGRVYLHVEYTLESTVETVVNDDAIMLIAPDGNTLSPIADRGGPIEIDVATELTATFEVDEPVGDGYILRYVERFARGEVDVPLSVS